MIDSKFWCEKALSSLFSLWNSEDGKHHAWRTSDSMPNSRRDTTFHDRYFPTATFHSIMAFGDCGVWDGRKPYDKAKEIIETPDLKIRDVSNFSPYHEVLSTLVHQKVKSNSRDKADWVLAVIGSSSHSVPPGGDRPRALVRNGASSRHQPRQALVIGRLFQALRILTTQAIREKEGLQETLRLSNSAHSKEQCRERIAVLKSLLRNVEDGLVSATDLLCGVVRKSVIKGPVGEGGGQQSDGSGIATADDLANSPLVSPFMLLQVAIGVIERDILLSGFRLRPRRVSARQPTIRRLESDIKEVKKNLAQYFTREVDRMMSRRQIPLYPHYDAASLAFSTHGRLLLDRSFATESLFRACVEAVVTDQYEDGTWPVGRSATFDDTGTSIQQPSVAVALSLAECIFQPELLVDYREKKFELLKQGLAALQKTGQYLVNSFSPKCGPRDKCSGWVSDRVRWPNVSETWITAMAARLLHLLWLTERAFERYERLAKYTVRPPTTVSEVSHAGLLQVASEQKLKNGQRLKHKWERAIVEPDAFARPARMLTTKVLEPLQRQFDQRTNFIRPRGDGVSFIIFGPPGSGKTFFVETFAKVLGWPLIMLSPGHFIRNGLELIEAEAAKIFDDLMHLDHAVVLFDECDELFRMRPKEEGESSGRNILSFATASMLPKLQDLHDAKRLIFFLGTNYLANVDDAIRRSGRFDGILFFDRPDDAARRELIVRTVDEESSKRHKLSPNELESAVAYTRGWMVRDLTAYARSLLTKRQWLRPSIDDYEKWLAEQGDKELGASGLSNRVKEQIRQRWSLFELYAAEQNQRKKRNQKTPYELY